MRLRAQIFVILGLCILTQPVAAQEVENEEVEEAPVVSHAPQTLPSLLRGAEMKLIKKLEMVFYRDRETGETASLKLTPVMSPGCKLGLTYRF